MKEHSILIIDDEQVTHLILNQILKDDYLLMHANNAQDGINMLSENKINLILLDIQMPELNGLELLESLMADTVTKNIPVIIMTGSASSDIEQKARELGATDFIDKLLFVHDRNEIFKRVQGNIVTAVDVTDLNIDLAKISRNIANIFMAESIAGDFFTASRKLANSLMFEFDISYYSLWTLQDDRVNLVLSLGHHQQENFGPSDFIREEAYTKLTATRKPYFTNHAASKNTGIFAEYSIKNGLSAEIGVPLFSLTEKELIKNQMKIPISTGLFGFVIIKRQRVFSTKEFNMISRLLMQSGTVLYRMYQESRGDSIDTNLNLY